MRRTAGRPADADRRTPREQRVYELLDRLGIAYEYVDHPPAMTMEDCLEIDRILDAVICKNLFLCNRQQTQFYLLMLREDKRFRTAEVSKEIGSARLSFGPKEYMERFLDLSPGSVSVLGLMNDSGSRVQLLMDEDILRGEFFGCHPCVNTTSLRLRVSDLTDRILKEFGHEPILIKVQEG